MKNHINWLHKLAIFSIFILTCILFSGLGNDYLFEWDEAIYGQLGVELRTNQNILTPHWNQELWLEKPPAIAWVVALGQSLVSDPELGSRLFMPIFAAATLYAVLQIGTYLGGTYLGVSSMAILGYFNLFLSRSRVVNTDGMLLAAISWLLWLLLKGSSPWKVALFASLAIFAKGPAGLLSILIATPLLLAKPKKFLISTLFYLLIFTFPWHAYQLIVNGSNFYTPYLLEQVIRRATVPIEFHIESRWFYFYSLYKDLGLGVIVTAIIGLILLSKNKIVLAFWAFLPIIIFTLAKTRLSWYILPSYPGIALLVGNAISYFSKSRTSSRVIEVICIGMLAQMLYHVIIYTAPARARVQAELPPHIQAAQSLKNIESSEIAFLVSPSERVAEAILPIDQKISSSFRYGGAPSIVFYSGKKVNYYYNYENFQSDIRRGKYTHVIITASDIDKIPHGMVIMNSFNEYLVYKLGDIYAYR